MERAIRQLFGLIEDKSNKYNGYTKKKMNRFISCREHKG